MDDELEDKILYQTYLSHMKLVSKFAVGIPTVGVCPPLGHAWRIARTYILKPEVLIFGALVFAIFVYIHTLDLWSRTFLEKVQHTLGRTTSKVSRLNFFADDSSKGKRKWEFKQDYVAAYAIQGRRSHMEDRFVVNTNIDNTGVSLFAVFDGHGGEFAANYARDKLIPSISAQIVALKNILSGKSENLPSITDGGQVQSDVENVDSAANVNLVKRKKSIIKSVSTSNTDDCVDRNLGVTDPELINKLNSLTKTITREVKPCKTTEKEKDPPKINLMDYLDGNKINYSRLLTDQVLAIDKLLVEAAKKNLDVAGTTALIAIIEDNKLIVANVGDSRGVMCDSRGNAIPLSFDHKPQQQRERNRIIKAGGSVSFNGVWRVAGILATSRALGDYPLKDKKFVIADPDILTFDLDYHNPIFILLASDGLWDTFSNEEAVSFIKERMDEPDYGAKSITLQSYYRGSLDNVTVVVVNLKNRR